MNYNRERIKKFWMYCNNCGYQTSGVYFNPTNCPKCRRSLNFIYLNKEQWETHDRKIRDLGCREFARKFMVRGTIIKN